VYLTEEAALKQVFPDADKIEPALYTLTPEQKKKIEARLGWALSESTVKVYRGFQQANPQGYAVITQEIGKFKPITFIVKVTNEGQVERVEVLVYREPVGSEVRRQRFARQYKGKTAKDPLRINRDILNITGATMSVQGMTAGVKKVLVIRNELGLTR
jgi:FAD:protein FMN transferase